MKILVTGDREYKNVKKVHEILNKLNPKCIIQGGARGADTIAALYAEEKGICCVEVKANWNYYKKPAGPIRNGWMLKYCNPDLVVAFHDDLANSKGTKNMVEISRKSGLEVIVVE